MTTTLSPSPRLGLITSEQAAERLGVHLNTVYAMRRDGRLRGVRIGSGWRFRVADIDALLTP
ncbi:MAG: helix-turn-helix domain-containing protein [Gordonia amarae]